MTHALLVFDLDGTLVPTMEDYADKAASLMQEHFGTPWDEARRAYFRTSGLPFDKQLRQLYAGRPDTDGVAEQFEQWKDGYLRNIELPAATLSLFGEWRKRGFAIAISSNNLEPYVERMASDWPVDCALGYRPQDNFGKGEHHFAEFERRFRLARDRFVFTGDSPNDARIALAAGVEFRALITEAFSPRDFRAVSPDIRILNSLGELIGSLQALPSVD